MVLLIRALVSFIILAMLVTYAIIPLAKYIASFFKKEVKRIDESLTNTTEKKDDNNER